MSIADKWQHLINKQNTDLTNKFSGKVFCIGFNKTGTTSVGHVLSDFGYKLGNQAAAEMLLFDWYKKDYSRLIRYCRSYEAFQDFPFSLPDTYQFLDEAFSDAKFILTVRDSKEQWFQSLVRYHTKLFSTDKHRPPTEDDLENALYRYKGFALDAIRIVFNYPEVKLYDFDYYTKLYEKHNNNVIEYFTNRPDRLLVLNVSNPNAYQDLASFLNVRVSGKKQFPWKNKS